jgi:hypothetical protein
MDSFSFLLKLSAVFDHFKESSNVKMLFNKQFKDALSSFGPFFISMFI